MREWSAIRIRRNRIKAEDLGAGERGLTLVELIVTFTILSILAMAAVPVVHIEVQRRQEQELRRDLWMMRAAIDKYKDAADANLIQIKADSRGYPPTLEELVKGVDIKGHKTRFLRRIPIDPMMNNQDWGVRSNKDDPTSDTGSGDSVFDVFTKSTGVALDGTKYSDW